MLRDEKFKIIENREVKPGIFKMIIQATAVSIRPGQFVNIKIAGKYLRRPISVCDYDGEKITLMYKVVGGGTEALSELAPGASLGLLLPLGNGWDAPAACGTPETENTCRIAQGLADDTASETSATTQPAPIAQPSQAAGPAAQLVPAIAQGKSALLIGGGMGAAPLLYLAKVLLGLGIPCTVLLGFASEKDDYISDTFSQLRLGTHAQSGTSELSIAHTLMPSACQSASVQLRDAQACEGMQSPACPSAPASLEVRIATLDGSLGEKGLVTDLIPSSPSDISKYSYYYTCGPEPMMRAVCEKIEKVSSGTLLGEASFEARMGCGFGACMGCTCKTKYGHKRICKDGPVLKNTEIIW